MIKVDCHLHLGLTPSQTPGWWMWEQFGEEPISIDGDWIVGMLDAAGIDVGMVQGGDIRRTTYHPDFPAEHDVYIPSDFTAGEVAKHPGRLYGVACIDPLRDIPGGLFELERCVRELDFRVLKLVPTYQHYAPNDPRLDPYYEKCLELDIPVQIHTGWTRTINAPMKYQNPIQLDAVGRKYRDLKVIVAHLGWPWVNEGVAVVAKHPNFYCEFSGWSTYGPAAVADALMKLKNYNAHTRVLYGSDNADNQDLYEQANALALEKYGEPALTDDEMAGLLGGNAAELFKITS